MFGTKENSKRGHGRGMAAWTKKCGWFLINYDVIVHNNRGGTNVECYSGKILHCMKMHERKPRMR